MTYEKKNINFANLTISRGYLHHLFEISAGIYGDAKHDLNNIGTALYGNLSLLEVYAKSIEKKLHEGSTTSKDIEEELRNFSLRIDISLRIGERLQKFINNFMSRPNSYEESIFISKPIHIFNRMVSIYNNIEIKLGDSCEKSLEILYPENALSAIIWEIINNVLKHCGYESTVLIDWDIRNATFHCEIHDNGKGIISDLGDSLITMRELSEPSSGIGSLGGISLINKHIIQSNGRLFFSKSEVLGGTAVVFEIPIYVYYIEGNLYELEEC